MTSYVLLKTAHVVFATLFLGAGLASVFYKVMADRTRDTRVVAATLAHLVVADAAFTVPAAVGLPVTGALMVHVADWGWSTPWVVAALVLYVVAAGPWLVALVLQVQMRELARASLAARQPLPHLYHAKGRLWLGLGVPSFAAALAIVLIMVAKRVPWT